MSQLLQTKTFWGGIAAILTGISLTLAGNVPEGVNAIVSGLLAILVRDGIRKSAAANRPESER